MDDAKNVIFSLIPLILIVLFSWLFGLLGSRGKKPAEDMDQTTEKGPVDAPLDIFGQLRGQAGQSPPGQGNARVDERTATPIGIRVGRTAKSMDGPRVTPKPITPKWWGA